MKDHVSAHGAENPKDFKGRRRLQSTLGRTVSYLRQEDKEERKAAFLEPHSHWGHGNVGMPTQLLWSLSQDPWKGIATLLI